MLIALKLARPTNSRPYRIVEEQNHEVPARDESGELIDKGGYTTPGEAQQRVNDLRIREENR